MARSHFSAPHSMAGQGLVSMSTRVQKAPRLVSAALDGELQTTIDLSLQLLGSGLRIAHYPTVALLLQDGHTRPSAVVIDIWSSSGGGVNALQLCRRKFPDVPLCIHTRKDGHDQLFEALQAGATGYLIAPMDTEELVVSLKQIGKGNAALCPKAQQMMFGFVKECLDHQPFSPLSCREQDVLRLMKAGNFEKEIAERLKIKPGTLHSIVVAMYRKLGIHSREEALARHYPF